MGTILTIVRRFPILILFAFLALGGLAFREYLSGNAGDLRAGDCFDLPTTSGTTVKDVGHHPCNQTHTGEVFVVLKYPAASAATYPIAGSFTDFAVRQCPGPFATYTGSSVDVRTDLDFGMFYPTVEGWAGGDRDVTCYASRADNGPMTASVKATSSR